MKLQNQVCSLELAKKLKSLNVKQESLFNWEEPNKEWGWTDWVIQYGSNNDPQLKHYSAFTVAELGEMLPDVKEIFKFDDGWYGRYGETGEFTADTEADARAEMLIYLLENKLI